MMESHVPISIMVQKMPNIKLFSCSYQKTKLCIQMSCQAAVVITAYLFIVKYVIPIQVTIFNVLEYS